MNRVFRACSDRPGQSPAQVQESAVIKPSAKAPPIFYFYLGSVAIFASVVACRIMG
jgi:hypothetical protein